MGCLVSFLTLFLAYSLKAKGFAEKTLTNLVPCPQTPSVITSVKLELLVVPNLINAVGSLVQTMIEGTYFQIRILIFNPQQLMSIESI